MPVDLVDFAGLRHMPYPAVMARLVHEMWRLGHVRLDAVAGAMVVDVVV